MSYIITLREAVKFVKAFVDECGTAARNEALGGVISKPGLYGRQKNQKALEIFRGNMAWFCYNTKMEDYPKLFLSFEYSNEYEPDNIPDRPDSDNLVCPIADSVFQYKEDGQGIESLLRTQELKNPNAPVDQIISLEKVKEFTENYKGHSILGTRLNQHPCGFFENAEHQDISRFMAQDGLKYIRYYFGYGKSDKYENSRIRVVLIGVDRYGKNIVPNGLDERPDDKNDEPIPIILQKSWPPHPDK